MENPSLLAGTIKPELQQAAALDTAQPDYHMDNSFNGSHKNEGEFQAGNESNGNGNGNNNNSNNEQDNDGNSGGQDYSNDGNGDENDPQKDDFYTENQSKLTFVMKMGTRIS